MEEEEIKALAKRLTALVNRKNIFCAMCKNTKFIIQDGFVRPSMYDDVFGEKYKSTTIPQIMTLCAKCGHCDYFAAGNLVKLRMDIKVIEYFPIDVIK